MTYSRQQLIALALRRLGIPGAGQTAEAEDVAVIEETIDAVMADLGDRGIYSWGDSDEFDDSAVMHLAAILADAAAPSFDQPQDETVRLLAEKRLRALTVTSLSGQRQTTEYF
jgi:predicted alpha-1,6-mannanase (GH76 family)